MHNITVYSAQAAQAGLKEQKIAEGSLVNVRIVSSNGNGKYTSIVAGARVNLKSDSVLQNGDVFKAKISIKDNTIFLKPVQNNSSVQNSAKILLDNFPLKLVENEELLNFFARLGLPADNAMVNVFQMMKQLKMKMDLPLFLKIHNLSVKFGEKQKSAVEILMILQKKGIEVSKKELLELIEFVGGQEFGDFDGFEGNREGKKKAEENQRRILNSLNRMAGSWFVFPFCIMEKNRIGAGGGEIGIGGIADRAVDGVFEAGGASGKTDGSAGYDGMDGSLSGVWDGGEDVSQAKNQDDERKIGEGNIRILVNDSEKLEILNLSCFYKNAWNFASILYDNGFVKTLRVNFQNKLEKKEEVILYLKSKLEKIYLQGKTKNQIDVQWAEKDELAGFSCENERFYSINKRI